MSDSIESRVFADVMAVVNEVGPLMFAPEFQEACKQLPIMQSFAAELAVFLSDREAHLTSLQRIVNDPEFQEALATVTKRAADSTGGATQ